LVVEVVEVVEVVVGVGVGVVQVFCRCGLLVAATVVVAGGCCWVVVAGLKFGEMICEV
jgi:hypothetical protein